MNAIGRRLRRATRPLAPLYALTVRARNAAYARGLLEVRDVGVPVVSIGNLTTGGTGKSPLVRVVAGRIAARGGRPGILLRGYGARGALSLVPTWHDAPPRGALTRHGDEALEHTRALGEGAIVVAHADRVRAAAVARAAGANALVLDDGFQHRRIARQLDVVCLDAARPWGRGGLLPSGDLREGIDALARADLVMWTRARRGAPRPDLPRPLPAIAWRHAPGRCRRAGGSESLAPARVVVCAHVASPAVVAESARERGLEVVSSVGARDHAPFTRRLVEELERQRHQQGADVLLITAKDEPRWLEEPAGRRLAERGHVAVLEIAPEPLDATTPLDRALARLLSAGDDDARPPGGEAGASDPT